MFDEMDRMFGQMRRPMWSRPEWGVRGEEFGSDNLRLETTKEGYVVIADLPGFEKEEIDLRFDEGVLSINASHEVAEDNSMRSRHVHESISVPGSVLEDEISATYRNGVLEVTLPTEEDVTEESHRIDIE
ncbi:Hsp20/alpha crystallin family protein [Natronomonas sp. EA1]|uniref:Hsp20/alpha crystallin family protein n=1 Tax=Natronomonas sp. EA1 TaxID=3421655 RepID=UPI003EBCA41C